MTGSVREVVQRALKALERDGAVRLERAHVIVLDPDALERWSEADGRSAPGGGEPAQAPPSTRAR